MFRSFVNMSSSSDENEHLKELHRSKKRAKLGRLSDASRKIRAMSHVEGEDCKCNRFKCFTIITLDERKLILKQFNLLGSKDKQDNHLAGLISVLPIKRRRPRKGEDESSLHANSYSYKVRVLRDDDMIEVQVCHKAFLALHGITNQNVQTIKKALVLTGQAPIDGRGRHNNRVHRLTDETLTKIHEHITSLKGRRSHYSGHDSKKIYLPEELDITKLHNMYLEKFPLNQVSYETYRQIFNTKYNISFGYPRSDSCSMCDQYIAKLLHLEQKLKTSNSVNEKFHCVTELRKTNIAKTEHVNKANKFYDRKRLAKNFARKRTDSEAICFDFMKNLPVPNITTNDTYYRRQFSFYMFNVHILSSGESIFFTYDQTIAKKGSDDVVSMMYFFFANILSDYVRHVELFCDSCAGQNKNYTVIRFLHLLIHKVGRFESVHITFPVRGHSYMECDKNMGNIKQNVRIELPVEWNEHIRASRVKPSPFVVVECEPHLFNNWGSYLGRFYKKKCPFPTRSISELKITKENTRTVQLRKTYGGPWESYIIKDIIDKRSIPLEDDSGPGVLYSGCIPVPQAKYNDLQVLKRFCSPSAQEFFTNLPSSAASNVNQNDEDNVFHE